MERYFDLQGASLAVTAAEPALLDLYGKVFDGIGFDTPPAPVCFAVSLEAGEPEDLPEGATVLYDGPVLSEGRCIAAESDGELIQLFPGKASLRMSTSERRATLIVAPDERRRVVMNLGMMVLEAALRASGQVPIHAAGLTLEGQIIMVIGQSGAGKTTTALALCGAGFGLCSDDLMICRAVGDSVTAWGLPRSLKVHRRSAAMLPWTAPLLVGNWSDEDEKALPLAALRGAVRVEDSRPRPVMAIGLLERTRSDRSALGAVGQAEILAIAAADHIRTSRQGVLPGHAGRLAALAAIMRRLPAHRIMAGTDPTDLGPVFAAGLTPAEAQR